MPNQLKEKVIIPSWNIIKDDIKIKKFYILPWVLSIIFLTVLLVYQSIYTYVVVFWKKEEALVLILNFFHSEYILEVLIWALIFMIIYFLLTPIFEGWLIKYIDSKEKKIQLSTSEAFGQWIYNFFPLFKYNNIFSEFKIISILNWYLFIIRFIGIDYIKVISYVFLVLLIFWILINILLVYSKYIIILENKNVYESIWKSSKMAIMNIKKTGKLYFLMFFLNIRVIINFIIFLSFPILMVLSIWLITSKLFLIVAISILTILFILLVLALWYLTAVLEILKTSIWYYSYKECLECINKHQIKENK